MADSNRTALEAKFWARVQKTESCWLWKGSLGRHGYGSLGVKVDGRWIAERAHRLSYRLFRGDIPTGMMVCHTCDVPRCVNPDHLFVGDSFDNIRDCVRKRRHAAQKRTRCPQGHEYTADNTLIRPNGHRHCRACETIRVSQRSANKQGLPEAAMSTCAGCHNPTRRKCRRCEQWVCRDCASNHPRAADNPKPCVRHPIVCARCGLRVIGWLYGWKHAAGSNAKSCGMTPEPVWQ